LLRGVKFKVLTLKTKLNNVLLVVTPCNLGQISWCSERKLLPSFPRRSRTQSVSCAEHPDRQL